MNECPYHVTVESIMNYASMQLPHQEDLGQAVVGRHLEQPVFLEWDFPRQLLPQAGQQMLSWTRKLTSSQSPLALAQLEQLGMRKTLSDPLSRPWLRLPSIRSPE